MDLDLAFEEGTSGASRLTSGSLRIEEVASLVVTSGQIYAGDALIAPAGATFSQRVPVGVYRVLLSIATFKNGDQRVAFARVEIASGRPVRWETATADGQDPATLGEGEFFGYPVDSGTGGFMDRDVAVRRRALSRSESTAFNERVLDEFFGHAVNTWYWADVTFDTSTGANLVGFASGWGDGFYPSYWGYDAHDSVLCLVTDFGVFDDEDDDDDEEEE